MHALLQRLPLRFLWYACAPLTLIYAGPPQASCGSVCSNPSADMVLLQRQTTVDRVDQKNTLTVQCVDMPLSGAWGGGGAYTCKTFEIYGTAYCAHEVINKACCICGGGKTASSPSPNTNPTLQPVTTPATPAPTSMPTPVPTPSQKVPLPTQRPTNTSTQAPQPPASHVCIPQSVLMCINDASSYWPKCDVSQSKNSVGPGGYEFGHYCSSEWTNALNIVLSDAAISKCHDRNAIHKFLAQVAHETAFFSTVYQPRDGGAGLIHMIPQNWGPNAQDMDILWPGNNYESKAASMGHTFFQTADYGWRSVAAWYKRTNRVVPGCGSDLFDQSYSTQTRCIFGYVNDRSFEYKTVGRCLQQASALTPVPKPAFAPVPSIPSTSPIPSGPSEGWKAWVGSGITWHGPAYDVDTFCRSGATIGNACWRLDNQPSFKQTTLKDFCARPHHQIAFGHPATQACGECTEIRVKRNDGGYNSIVVMTIDVPGPGNTSPELSTAGKDHLDLDTNLQRSDRQPFEWRKVPCST